MDFRLSIQLGQGSCSRNKWWTGTTKNEGTIRYSDYMQDGGDWSVWAGDSSYKNAEAVRVGIWTEDDEDSFCLTDTDIRFCIQLSDSCSNSNGNTNRAGDEMCTPWASAGGGWSNFASPSDGKDFDAARITVETQDAPGLEIYDVQIGAWVNDNGCRNTMKAGDPVYSSWLVTGGGGHTNWASDNDWKSPDGIAVYMGLYTNTNGITYNMASAFTVTAEDEESSGLSTGAVIGIIAAVLACCLLTGFGIMWHRRRNKVLAAGVDDDEVIGTLEDTGVTGGEDKTGYDMSPIGMDTAENPDAENEIMIEVEVTETQD